MALILGLESSCDDTAAALVTSDRRFSRSWWFRKTRRTARSAGWFRRSPPAPMCRSCRASSERGAWRARTSTSRCRCDRRDRRTGADRRGDGRAADRQGAGAFARQAADRGQPSRRPCALARGSSIPTSLSLSAAAGLRRPLPAPRSARGRLVPAARDDHRRCRRRGVRQGGQAARPRLSRRSGDRAAGAKAIPSRGAAAAAAGRLGRAAFFLCGPKERGSARGRIRRVLARRYRRQLPAGGVDCLVDRTRLALGKAARRRWSSPAGSPPTRRSARAPAAGADTAAGFSVPPAWLCTDNAAMIAWAGAERFAAWNGRRLTLRRGPLAARSKCRKGARRGGEGMIGSRMAVIGGGAWGTALAQVAAPAAETLLWAREPEVVESDQQPREPAVPAGISAEPGDPRDGDLSDSADCDAWLVVTPAQHMRAGARARPRCDAPMVLCSKGIEERAASSSPGGAQACPGAPSRSCRARPSLTKSPPAFRPRSPSPPTIRSLAEALRAASPSRPSGSTQRRRRRRRDRRRGQERARDRLRSRRGPGLGQNARAALIAAALPK
jgi:hypothetical protein